MYDQNDTIAAVASPRGPAPRGIIRLAGPDSLSIVEQLAGQSIVASTAKLIEAVDLEIQLAGQAYQVRSDLFVWPDSRSYTQQPAVEIHTLGSAPILEALLKGCLAAGARLAGPGEFTLRAFLAGRLDLVQAEAVMAVVDARHASLLDTALSQLAGGLSGPLNRLRDELLSLLADLEAGLDFVDEEDVSFVETQELINRIRTGRDIVALAVEQTQARGQSDSTQRVALVGPRNAGKSSLFNALVDRFGQANDHTEALVADQPGVTRDSLSAYVEFDKICCELIDTAGVDELPAECPIDELAQNRAIASYEQYDLLLQCQPCDQLSEQARWSASLGREQMLLLTKADIGSVNIEIEGAIKVSAQLGDGLEELATQISNRLATTVQESSSEVVAQTATRCAGSLIEAEHCLGRAAEIAEQQGGDELVSLELRSALDALGRVVGQVVTDDILDQIFGKFCIGK